MFVFQHLHFFSQAFRSIALFHRANYLQYMLTMIEMLVYIMNSNAAFFFGGGYLLGVPVSILIVALVFALLYLAITRTALGLFLQAIGINPTSTSK